MGNITTTGASLEVGALLILHQIILALPEGAPFRLRVAPSRTRFDLRTADVIPVVAGSDSDVMLGVAEV